MSKKPSVSSSFRFGLGEIVKDKVTGLEGPIVSRGDHISGCSTYGIQPSTLKDGLPLAVKWFDEPRLTDTGRSMPIVDERDDRTGADTTPPSAVRAAGR